VIFAASVLFGVMAICVRLAAREMDALQVAFVRFAGSFVVLLVASGGRDLRPSPGVGPRLALRALLGATAIVCYYIGIRDIGAGPATMLHCTYPVFATVFSVLFMEEAFTGRLAGALAMNLGGNFLERDDGDPRRPESDRHDQEHHGRDHPGLARLDR